MKDYNDDLSDDEAYELALALSLGAEDQAKTANPQKSPAASSQQSLDLEKYQFAVKADDPVDEHAELMTSTPAASSAWNQVVDDLMADYIKDIKDKKTDNLGHIKALCPPCLTPAPKKPSLRRKNLSSVQTTALIKARWVIYNRLIDLGALWAEQSAGLTDLPRQLDGHHIAGAINLMDMPIRKEDSVLMMRVALSEELPQDQSATLNNWTDEETLFMKKFRQLQALAKPAACDEREISSSLKKTRGDETATVRPPLPAFDISGAPRDYYNIVDWAYWCAIFDEVNLRVEKSGIVW